MMRTTRAIATAMVLFAAAPVLAQSPRQLTADDYRQAEKRASARGGTLAGFYHSHPNEPARPSAYDLAHAWPNFVYVIISVRDRVPGDITVWHLRDDRSAFDEGELRWPTGS